MKKLYCSIILVIVFSSLLFSQWLQQNFIDFKHIYCIDIKDSVGVLGGWSPSSGNTGILYYSTDAGNSWLVSQLPDSILDIEGVQIINNNLIFASGTKAKSSSTSGKDPLFLYSTDGGHHWQTEGTWPDSVYALHRMHFNDTQTGFVIAETASQVNGIMKTTDGGLTWNWSFWYANVNVHSVSFFDMQNGYLSGQTNMSGNLGGIYAITTNGGSSWTRAWAPFTTDVPEIKNLASGKVALLAQNITSGTNLMLSTDNGNSWTSKKYIPGPVQFGGINGSASGLILIFGVIEPTGSSVPFIYASFDYGLNWHESTFTPLTNVHLYHSKIINDMEWFITGHYFGQYGILLHTTNSGGLPVDLIAFTAVQLNKTVLMEWITATEINNHGFEIQRKTPDSDFMTVGFVKGKGTSTERIKYTYTDIPGNPADRLIYRLKQVDYNGNYSYSTEVVVDNISHLGFSLQQNYPNPFNPLTLIRYSVPKESRITITVYNGLGREVTTLVDEEKPAGEYETKWNAENNPTGVYFCRMKAGNYSETRKLTLMK
jgi:hypothetical protein